MSEKPATTESAEATEEREAEPRGEAPTARASDEASEASEARARNKGKKAKLKAKRRKKKRKPSDGSPSESEIDAVASVKTPLKPPEDSEDKPKKVAADEKKPAKEAVAKAPEPKTGEAKDESEDREPEAAKTEAKKPEASKTEAKKTESKKTESKKTEPRAKTRKRKKAEVEAKDGDKPAAAARDEAGDEASDEASTAGLASEILGELTASEESLTKSEIRKKRRRKRKKRLRKKKPRIAVDTAELSDTNPRKAEKAGAAIEGINITLEPPAVAKKIAEERRARGLNALDESAGDGASAGVEVVSEADEVVEVAPEARAKAKKAQEPEEGAIEVVAEPGAKTRRSRKADKAAPPVDDDDGEVIEVVGGPVEEAEATPKAKATRRSRKADADKHSGKKDGGKDGDDGVIEVVGGPAVDLDEEEVEVVEDKEPRRGSARTRSLKKGSKAESSAATKRPPGRRDSGKRKATRREKRPTAARERRARDGEAPTKKKSPAVPIAIGGGALLLVIAAAALSAGGGGDGEAARQAYIARRDERVDEAVKNSAGKVGADFSGASERLKILATVYKDGGVRRKLTRALEDLKAAHNEAGADALDEALLEAQSALDSGDPQRALAAIDAFPEAFRPLPAWRERGRQTLDRVLVRLRAEEEGRPLLERAEELKEKGENNRALGVLAAFSSEHSDTAVGKEIEKLRDRIEFIRAKKADNEARLAEVRSRQKGVLARREAEEARLKKLLEAESEGTWQRQTGSTLFTWQISNTQPIKRDQIWSLEGKTLSGKNGSGRTRFLAKSQRQWRSFIVRFEVRLEAGSWGFMARTDRVITPTRQQILSFERLEPSQKRGEWVAMKIYVVGGNFFEVVNDGERRPLNAAERQQPKEAGGFGFVLPANARASFRNIEALVLERADS